MESISSWTLVLSSTLMTAPLDRYFTRVCAQGQLALGGFRSAEPGLGQPRRPLPTDRRRRKRPRRRAGAPIRELAHALEGDGGVFAPVVSRGGDYGRYLHVERFHARVGVRPAVIELVCDELAQERAQRGALEQERAGRDQETDRVLDGSDGVDELVALDEIQ